MNIQARLAKKEKRSKEVCERIALRELPQRDQSLTVQKSGATVRSPPAAELQTETRPENLPNSSETRYNSQFFSGPGNLRIRATGISSGAPPISGISGGWVAMRKPELEQRCFWRSQN